MKQQVRGEFGSKPRVREKTQVDAKVHADDTQHDHVRLEKCFMVLSINNPKNPGFSHSKLLPLPEKVAPVGRLDERVSLAFRLVSTPSRFGTIEG